MTLAGTSWYASVFLIVNAGLGAGLLNFPAEYHQCGGIVVAVSIQAVRLCLFLCIHFLFADLSFCLLTYIICVYFICSFYDIDNASNKR